MGDATLPLVGLCAHSSWRSWHQDKGLTLWTSGIVLPSTHIGQFILMLAMEGITLLLPISFLEHRTWLAASLRAHSGTRLARGVRKGGLWSEWVREP